MKFIFAILLAATLLSTGCIKIIKPVIHETECVGHHVGHGHHGHHDDDGRCKDRD